MIMFFRFYFTLLFLMPSASMADIANSCKPEHKFCIAVANKLSFIFTNVIDLLFWVVLAFLAIQFIFWVFNIIYNAFVSVGSEVSTKVSDLYQNYRMGEKGEYVKLPDGSFVLADSKQARWLEYDGQTVHFSNLEFDYRHRYMFDDPAIDYLGKEQPEIIGYNDTEYDDVWSGGHSPRDDVFSFDPKTGEVDDDFDESRW